MVYQNSATTVAHTTMQYGHSAPMSYSAWSISQCTNTTPSAVPACRPSQNQRRYAAPASSPAPIAASAPKAARPSSGFGKPNTSACSVRITEPQLITGLMLQLGM